MSKHVLFEIGIEELPARFIDDAENQLHEKTETWLQENLLKYDKIKTYSTPRRLAVIIKQIAAKQEDKTEEVRGPQLKIAKDEKGNWTKAAIGFTKGQGKSTDDIYIKDEKGTEYIYVEKHEIGKQVEEVLPTFSDVISSLTFPQTMRWGSGSFRFARPIRWLVALVDESVIPFEVGGVQSDRYSFGHRFLGKKTNITNPLAYEQLLEQNFVIADAEKRKETIVKQLKEIAEREQFTIEVDEKLLNEVTNLVEYPTAFHGTFADSYLKLPEEPLITSMKEHQRYFPVRDKETEKLLPYFVSVRNGDDRALDNVVKGNEKVLRARLADGVFFYDEDRSFSIDHFIEKLNTVVFQEKIGTVTEKLARMKQLTNDICTLLDVDESIRKHAVRAAEICKFDLTTSMVNEFTELQGTMGEIYALHYNETKEVASAIREHYLPAQANGPLPTTEVGAIVSIADKLDTIVGIISVGLLPTGSQDPYGLRRQAFGILRILKENKWNIELEQLLQLTYEQYDEIDSDTDDAVRTFFKNRAAYLLEEHDMTPDVIEAVLANDIGNIHYAIDKGHLLAEKRNDPSFKRTQEALVRVLNLNKQAADGDIKPSLFETGAEKRLYEAYEKTVQTFNKNNERLDAEQTLHQLETLTEPIHTFFDETMVMVEDESLRHNRLSLIRSISNLIMSFADVTAVEWKQHAD